MYCQVSRGYLKKKYRCTASFCKAVGSYENSDGTWGGGLHCNAKQVRTGGDKGNPVIKVGFFCNNLRSFLVTGKKIITKFCRIFLHDPCSTLSGVAMARNMKMCSRPSKNCMVLHLTTFQRFNQDTFLIMS